MAYSGIGMYVGTDGSGGYQVDTKLTDVAFHTPQPSTVLRQFLSFRENLGKNEGDTVHRNKWGNISTAGAAVAESATIPTDRALPITQSTAVVAEYGNSASLKSKLADLANLDINSEVIQGLRNDNVKTIDGVLYSNVYDACLFRYVGTTTASGAITIDGTATATATGGFNVYHARGMRKKLRSVNAPPIPGTGRYAAILSLDAEEGLYADSAWTNFQHYTNSAGILNGYIGTMYGIDFVVETNSLSGNEVYMVGWGYGTEDLVMPPEVRTNAAIAAMMGSSSDFGRKIDLAWYEMAAFGTLWNDATNCHCIKFDTA